jgi:YVTN family beta-propeller protein
VIDTKTSAVIARWPAGKGPLGIAVSPVSGELYVADWYDRIVRVLDPATGAIKAEIEVGQSPSGIDISEDGRRVVVANRDSNSSSLIDGETHRQAGQLAVGERPFGITMAADALAFTADVGSDDVSVVQIGVPGAGERGAGVKATVKVGRRPYAVALSDKRAFVTDQYGGTVSVIDLASLKKTDTIEACDHPEGINYDIRRHSLYVACWFDNKLIRIDAESLKITGTVAVGDGPRAFGKFLK